MKQRQFHNPFKDKEGNIYAGVTLAGNQQGNVLSFIIKLDKETFETGTVTEDYIIKNQAAFTDSPYKLPCKTFRRRILKEGGTLL